MVLAAGLGTRMRPITDSIPKPLVKVAGSTLLDHALAGLERAGVTQAAVNVHYLPEQIEEHLSARQGLAIAISDERKQLLDSGGGVKKALPLLMPGPLFVLNADSFWIDAGPPTLTRMASRWNPDAMDMLLLLARKDQSVGFHGAGDFFQDDLGRLTRRGDASSAPFAFAGASILQTKTFEEEAEDKFSLNKLFDDAIAKGRLYGAVLDGLWLHVGTPEAIGESEQAINAFKAQVP